MQGGLKLTDFKLRDMALKCSWVKILEQDTAMANIAYHCIQPELKSWIFDCNLNKRDISCLNIANTFWNDVMCAWCTYNYEDTAVKDQILWFNSRIRIDDAPIYWRKAFEKGLFKVHQLFSQGRVISIKEAYENFGLSFLKLHALIDCLPKDIKKEYTEKSHEQQNDSPQTGKCSKYAKALDIKNLSQYVYNELLFKKDDNKIHAIIEKWQINLGKDISIEEFYSHVQNIYKTTNLAKYCSFQYRLLMRSIVTNRQLKHWGIKESNTCTFCSNHVETIEHLFFCCEYVQELWARILKHFAKIDKFTVDSVLLNCIHDNPHNIANFVCLATKQYIYRQRCFGKRPKYLELINFINLLENSECYIARKNGHVEKHVTKWASFDKTNL